MNPLPRTEHDEPAQSPEVATPPAAAPATRIRGFDGLRAVSTLLVFYEHKVQDNGVGSVGVWIFFCLSGYLIIGILHRSRKKVEKEGSSAGSTLLEFWRNRALRILPIYYGTLLVVFAASRGFHAKEFAVYVAYLQNFYIGLISHRWGVITHFWSLAIEQQFYLLAAPALLFTASTRHRVIAASTFCVCLAFLAASMAFEWNTVTVSLMPLSNFAFMAVGAYVCLSGEGSPIFRLLGHPATLVVTTGALVTVFARLWLRGARVEAPPVYFYFIALAFVGSLVCATVRHGRGRLVSLLETRLMRWLGTISYGFYVYHYLTPSRGTVANLLHLQEEAMPPDAIRIAVQLAASLLLAHLSWEYFEKRFLAMKRSYSPSRISGVRGR